MKRNIRKWFNRWRYREVEWWEFWNPQSGPIGGAIIGTLLPILLLVYLYSLV